MYERAKHFDVLSKSPCFVAFLSDAFSRSSIALLVNETIKTSLVHPSEFGSPLARIRCHEAMILIPVNNKAEGRWGNRIALPHPSLTLIGSERELYTPITVAVNLGDVPSESRWQTSLIQYGDNGLVAHTVKCLGKIERRNMYLLQVTPCVI